MILRKINAVIGLLTTLLIMDHAMFYSVWMLSRCTIEKSADNMPWILVGLMILHMVLSIILVIRSRKGAEKRKLNTYPNLNKATYIQRVTGILMIILIGFHILGAANHFQPQMLHAVIHPVFFAAALAHVSVSTGKALITLGIGNSKVVKIIDIVMGVICAVTFVAGVIGFYLCLFVGVAA